MTISPQTKSFHPQSPFTDLLPQLCYLFPHSLSCRLVLCHSLHDLQDLLLILGPLLIEVLNIICPTTMEVVMELNSVDMVDFSSSTSECFTCSFSMCSLSFPLHELINTSAARISCCSPLFPFAMRCSAVSIPRSRPPSGNFPGWN